MKITATVKEIEAILNATKEVATELAKSKELNIKPERIEQECSIADTFIENKCGSFKYQSTETDSENAFEVKFNPEFVEDIANTLCSPIGIRLAKFAVSTIKFIVSLEKDLKKLTKAFDKKWGTSIRR